jgi:hypothetical protein
LTNCHRHTRHVIIKTQINICLTVEFKCISLVSGLTIKPLRHFQTELELNGSTMVPLEFRRWKEAKG